MQDTAGEAGTNSYEMYSYGPPHMAVQKQDDQHEYTFSSYVKLRDVVLKTCLGRWTIGRSSERGSGISVLPAWHDDDDLLLYILQANLYPWNSTDALKRLKKSKKKSKSLDYILLQVIQANIFL